MGDVIDHVGIYGSRVAEGLSAFNVGLVKSVEFASHIILGMHNFMLVGCDLHNWNCQCIQIYPTSCMAESCGDNRHTHAHSFSMTFFHSIYEVPRMQCMTLFRIWNTKQTVRDFYYDMEYTRLSYKNYSCHHCNWRRDVMTPCQMYFGTTALVNH